MQGGIHLAVHHLRRLCAQRGDHVAHHVRLLHPDGQPLQIIQPGHLFPGVEAAHTGVEPRKPYQVHPIQYGQKLIADAAVQHPPHLLGIAVQVRQLQHAELRLVLCQLAQGHAGKIHPAELHLLDDALLCAQFRPAVNHHLHPTIRALRHKLGKGLCRLAGGVVLRLVLRIAQDERLLLLRRSRLRRTACNCQRRGCRKQTQQLTAGHSRASRAAFAASFRYWVGVMPVRFLKARAK